MNLLKTLAPGAILISLAGLAPGGSSLSQQIFEVMMKAPGVQPGYRVVHAKGVVCEGSFEATPQAAKLSKAAHFQGTTVPVTVRFSDGASDPTIPDTSPDATPRGMAIRFALGEGRVTDIVAISHNGFLVSTGEEFLALQIALVGTDQTKPHPWPIEGFLGTHPRALKFVQDPKPVPVSFATESFFGNNAFRFVDQDGVKRAGRYQILPAGGPKYLSEAEAKERPADFAAAELSTRLANGPAKFRLVLQLAGEGDPTNDSSLVWPEDRKTVELGVISLKTVVPDSAAAERALFFDPARLTQGIEFSDDPLPALRSQVYALAAAHRRSH